MRTARLITVVVLAIVAIGALFWGRRPHQTAKVGSTVSNGISSVSTTGESPASQNTSLPLNRSNDASNFAQASLEQQRQLEQMGVTPGMTKEQMQQKLSSWAKSQRDAVVANWQKPIDFYGRVLDQSNAPVADAQVHFIWTDTSANGSSEANESTDAQGNFELSGKPGDYYKSG